MNTADEHSVGGLSGQGSCSSSRERPNAQERERDRGGERERETDRREGEVGQGRARSGKVKRHFKVHFIVSRTSLNGLASPNPRPPPNEPTVTCAHTPHPKARGAAAKGSGQRAVGGKVGPLGALGALGAGIYLYIYTYIYIQVSTAVAGPSTVGGGESVHVDSAGGGGGRWRAVHHEVSLDREVLGHPATVGRRGQWRGEGNGQ